MSSFYETYVSDTTAGMAAQTLFDGDGRARVGRVYVQVTHGGEEYALLFTGAVDTTFADGIRTRVGDECDPFVIRSLRVGRCASCDMNTAAEPPSWQAVTFGGQPSCEVRGGDITATDPIPLTAAAGDTLCVELTFQGDGRIPCHEEIQIPTFVKTDDTFAPSPLLPVPVMVGVKRKVSVRVAFFGDSITQGIGSTPGAYCHWAALAANAIGGDAAFWNLGIGFARSGDAATDGGWLSRAKQNDVVVLCLGVNDILRGVSAANITSNIQSVIALLHRAGCRVLLQSVPPFEFSAAQWAVRREVNERIRGMGDVFFDNAAFLCDGEHPRYGGHPNDEGCAVWAQRLTPILQSML